MCQSVVLAESLLTIRPEQKRTPVSSCLLERTICTAEGVDAIGAVPLRLCER
jgi:hypothetical protein